MHAYIFCVAFAISSEHTKQGDRELSICNRFYHRVLQARGRWIGLGCSKQKKRAKMRQGQAIFSNSLIRNVCRSFYLLLFRLRVEMKSIKATLVCCCLLRRCNTVENKRTYSTFRNSLCLGNCKFI